MAPEYTKAANILHDESSEIRLAKVDATVQTLLKQKFEIKGFPTIKFFTNGEPVTYTGGRKANDIVTFVKKQSNSIGIEL